MIEEVRKKCKDAGSTDRRMIWSSDLDETLELENLIDQAALESYSTEARKESREAHAHEDFPECDDENWSKHALSWLNKPYREVAEVALRYQASSQRFAPVYRNSDSWTNDDSPIDEVMKKCKQVGIADRSEVWNTDLIETRVLVNFCNLAAQEMCSAEARKEAQGTGLATTNAGAKLTLTGMDKPYVEDAEVVLKHHGVIDQPRDREMHPGPPAKPACRLQSLSFGHLLAAVRYLLVYGLLSDAGSSLTLEAEGRVLIPTLAQDKTPSRPCLSVLKEYWGARHGVLAARL